MNIPWIPLTDVRYAMANLATMYYNDPWKELNVIGLTGTKGKSTTTYYIKAVSYTHLFGSGPSEDVYEYVRYFEADYYALDNSRQVQMLLEEKGIRCIDLAFLKSTDMKFDIIFMSSVFPVSYTHLLFIDVQCESN